jgi:hypothetical protein
MKGERWENRVVSIAKPCVEDSGTEENCEASYINLHPIKDK